MCTHCQRLEHETSNSMSLSARRDTGRESISRDRIDGNDPATTNGDFQMFCFLVQRGCRVDLENEFASVQKQWLERLQTWEESRLVK